MKESRKLFRWGVINVNVLPRVGLVSGMGNIMLMDAANGVQLVEG